MDAKLQKIQITPVKLDADGNAKTPEAAVIALEVPIDTKLQKDAIIALMNNSIGAELLQVSIEPKQLRFDFEADGERKDSEADPSEIETGRSPIEIGRSPRASESDAEGVAPRIEVLSERETADIMERETDLEVDAETEARLLSEAIEAEGDASG